MKERYPYINNPYEFKLPEPKPIVHPVIHKWDDFPEEDKVIFKSIKDRIVSEIGDCRITAYGSKVNGNWDEDSDYDVIVYKDVDIATKMKFWKHGLNGLKADIQFVSPGYRSSLLEVEII